MEQLGTILGQNLAIVSISRHGVLQGIRLLEHVPDATLYVPDASGHAEGHSASRVYHEPVGELLTRLFGDGHSLVVFGALGLVIRVLAPSLRSKNQDPAVVVVDEKAQHAISVLSGHRGGANSLTRFVARALGAVPVITTASDVHGLPALDLLGQEMGWELEDASGLLPAMAALVNEKPLLIFQDSGDLNWWKGPCPKHVRMVNTLDLCDLNAYHAMVLVTDRTLDQIIPKRWGVADLPPLVLYRPKTLVIGIGCERGVSEAEIEQAVRASLTQHGLAMTSVYCVASIDVKRDELGLKGFAHGHQLPIRWFTAEALGQVDSPTPSALVQRHVGTPGVAEPAAVLASHHGPLVVAKVKHGRVTVAIARDEKLSSRSGQIFVVGLGSGERADLTPRARVALEEAEVVLGYKKYLEQIQDLLTTKEVVPGELTKEYDRAEKTVQLAEEGKRVALVSSGDSGIYGMAGLVFEVLDERGWDSSSAIPVEVVPGVTALSSCASLLGAPLMHDFAAISLSDLLTPWSVIVNRLEAAAQSDFVIVLYNPKSARRVSQFVDACQLLLHHRPAHTVVGLISRAGRPGFRREVTTLGCLAECAVDMETTIFVGNASTRLVGDRMVTPRGYSQKTRPNSIAEGAVVRGVKATV